MAEDPKILDVADMKRIEDYYVNSIRSFYDEKNFKEIDYSAREARRKAGRKEKEEAGLGIQLRTDEEGRPSKKRLTGVSGDIRGPAYQYTLPKKVVLGVKGEDREITDLYLTDEGKIAFEETVFISKKSNKKLTLAEAFSQKGQDEGIRTESVTGGGLSTDDLNNIARKLNFKNAKELKDELLNKAGEQGVTPKTGKVDTSKYN